MTDNENKNENDYISSITLPNGVTYNIKDASVLESIQEAITNGTLAMHKLTFGANGAYVYDGSQEVTVPVYTGTII